MNLSVRYAAHLVLASCLSVACSSGGDDATASRVSQGAGGAGGAAGGVATAGSGGAGGDPGAGGAGQSGAGGGGHAGTGVAGKSGSGGAPQSSCPATPPVGAACSGSPMCSYKANCCSCGCDSVLYTCKNGVFAVDGYNDLCATCGPPGGKGGAAGSAGAGGKSGAAGAAGSAGAGTAGAAGAGGATMGADYPGAIVVGVTTDDYIVFGDGDTVRVAPFGGGPAQAAAPLPKGIFYVSGPVVFAWGSSTEDATTTLDVWSAATGPVHISDKANSGAGAVSNDGTQISYFEGAKAVRANTDGSAHVTWTDTSCANSDLTLGASYVDHHFVVQCKGKVVSNDGASDSATVLCDGCVSPWPYGRGTRVLALDPGYANPRLVSLDGASIDPLPMGAYPAPALLSGSVGAVYRSMDGVGNLWHPGDANPVALTPAGFQVFVGPSQITLAGDDSGAAFSGATTSVWADLAKTNAPVSLPGQFVTLTQDGTLVVYSDASGALFAIPRVGGAKANVVASHDWARAIGGTRLLVRSGATLSIVDAGATTKAPMLIANDVQLNTPSWGGGMVVVSKDGTRAAFGTPAGIRVVVLP